MLKKFQQLRIYRSINIDKYRNNHRQEAEAEESRLADELQDARAVEEMKTVEERIKVANISLQGLTTLVDPVTHTVQQEMLNRMNKRKEESDTFDSVSGMGGGG